MYDCDNYLSTVIITLLYRVSAGFPLSVTAKIICIVPSVPYFVGTVNQALARSAFSILIGSPVRAVEMVNVPASP